jgi:hypothetical protein
MVAMDVAVPVDLENLERHIDVDWFVLVRAVLILQGLIQGGLAFADEHENLALA